MSHVPIEPKVFGYVLAGGESLRMQQAGAAPVDKALLLLDGSTLLERSLQTVAAACPGPRILCGPEHRCARLRSFGPTVPDRVALCGPVGAMQAALHDAAGRGGQWVLLVPVDLPWMTVAVLRMFVELAVGGGAAAACLRDDDGVQPLPCLVHVNALPAVEAALDRRDLKLLPLLRALAAGEPCLVDLPPGHAVPLFWNINTPADLRSAQTGETAGSSLHQSKHGGRTTGN